VDRRARRVDPVDQRPPGGGQANSQRRNHNRDHEGDSPQATLDSAWSRLELTPDPVKASLLKSANDAYRIGFLRGKPDLSRIYELRLLDEVLSAKTP